MPRNQNKRRVGDDGGAHWISYSDLATGLLLVFVLLLVSLLLIQKQTEAARARRVDVLLKRLEEVLSRQDKIGSELESYLTKNECRVEWRDGRIEFLDLENAFQSGETKLRKALIPELELCGGAIQQFLLDRSEYRDQVKAILIEGHTDAQRPLGYSDAYIGNLHLSLGRTEEVARYLSEIDDRKAFDQIRKARKARPESPMDPTDIRMFMVASGRSYADFDRDRRYRQDLFSSAVGGKCKDLALGKGLPEEPCSEWAKGKCGCYRRFDLMLRLDYEKLFGNIRDEIKDIRGALRQ